jgi:hypothetical protein
LVDADFALGAHVCQQSVKLRRTQKLDFGDLQWKYWLE